METQNTKTFRYDAAPIAAERRRRGVSQQQIAKDIGYTRQQVNRAEKGHSASFTLIRLLCNNLSVPLSDVIPDLALVA